MPLLHRKPFVRQKPPGDLRPDEEVFYCKVTNEIFRHYDSFCLGSPLRDSGRLAGDGKGTGSCGAHAVVLRDSARAGWGSRGPDSRIGEETVMKGVEEGESQPSSLQGALGAKGNLGAGAPQFCLGDLPPPSVANCAVLTPVVPDPGRCGRRCPAPGGSFRMTVSRPTRRNPAP